MLRAGGARLVMPFFVAPLRARFREQLDRDPRRHVLGVAMLGGTLAFLMDTDRFEGLLPPPFLVAALVVMGSYVGLLGLLFLAAAMSIGGRMLGGNGRAMHLRAAIAWASLPTLAAAGIWLLTLPFLGSPELDIAPRLAPGSTAASLLEIFRSVVLVGAAIEEAVLTYVFAAEAHGISVARAIAGHFVGLLVIVTPVLVVATAVLMIRNP
jgi:hypothetical protein